MEKNPETPLIPQPAEDHKLTPTFFGAILVMAGFLILLDQYLRTEWLSLTVIPAIGLILMATGLNTRRMGWIIPGLLVGTVGIAGVLLFGNLIGQIEFSERLGWAILSISTGFLAILFFSLLYAKHHSWWAFLVACILAGVAYPFISDRLNVFVFISSIAFMTGMGFLAWGFFERHLGLLIPGSLLAGIGPGFYLGFVLNAASNELVQIGFMITCLGLGWVMITLSHRMINPIFLWWPLIPGGILTMVGWGLTIGGNQRIAMSLIGNTGSISLIIFGLYLILMRRGIRK
jgi:hypothetical protein